MCSIAWGCDGTITLAVPVHSLTLLSLLPSLSWDLLISSLFDDANIAPGHSYFWHLWGKVHLTRPTAFSRTRTVLRFLFNLKYSWCVCVCVFLCVTGVGMLFGYPVPSDLYNHDIWSPHWRTHTYTGNGFAIFISIFNVGVKQMWLFILCSSFCNTCAVAMERFKNKSNNYQSLTWLSIHLVIFLAM